MAEGFNFDFCFFFKIFIHLFLALLGLWLQCVGFLSWGLLLLQHKGLIVAPQHVGSYQTRDRTRVPCASRQVLHHRTTKDVLDFCFDFSVSLLTLGLEITVKLSKCNRFFFFFWCFYKEEGDNTWSLEGVKSLKLLPFPLEAGKGHCFICQECLWKAHCIQLGLKAFVLIWAFLGIFGWENHNFRVDVCPLVAKEGSGFQFMSFSFV